MNQIPGAITLDELRSIAKMERWKASCAVSEGIAVGYIARAAVIEQLISEMESSSGDGVNGVIKEGDNPEGKAGLRRIGDCSVPCMHPEHNPPSHIVLQPGEYEWTCPECGRVTYFMVPMTIC